MGGKKKEKSHFSRGKKKSERFLWDFGIKKKLTVKEGGT